MPECIAMARQVATGNTAKTAFPYCRKLMGALLQGDGTNAAVMTIYRGGRATAGNELLVLKQVATVIETKDAWPSFMIDVDPPPVDAAIAGTVAIAGTTTLTGTGTAFLTTLAIGAIITVAGVKYRVTAVASDTSATIVLYTTGGTPTVTVSGVTYQVDRGGILVVVSGTAAVGYVYFTD